MSDEKIQEYVNFLDGLMSDYHPAFRKFRAGKNKAIKASGERESDNIRLILENYLNTNDDLHQIFMKFFPGFGYDEALSWQYFGRDIPRFIEHLRSINEQ